MSELVDAAGEFLLARSAVDDDRFLRDFASMSAFGATPAGGLEREAATPPHGAVRRWLAAWLEDRGFTVCRDRIGNMFGLVELNPDAPYVVVGSHTDSQPRGGRFDGAYGVLAAAHAVSRVCRHYRDTSAVPAVNLAVVDWFNEEGSRFKPSMMGSAVLTGKLDLDVALDTADTSGTTVRTALAAIGELGQLDVFDDAELPSAYVEIHIEQGRILDKQGIDIGLVTSTWAANKYEIAVVGAQAHTGATDMADRQDALYAAAKAVVAVRELADRYPEGRIHTSCGQLTVLPNSPVVVAREVRMHVDLRSPSSHILAEADAHLQQQFAEIAVTANVKFETRHAHVWKANFYHQSGVDLAQAAVRDLGFSSREIRTRAGHDSTNMKDIVPSIMLFVPSVDGISHAEQEFTEDRDLLNGVDLVAEILFRLTRGHALGGDHLDWNSLT